MEIDVRKDWFMNQHFNQEQLQQIYDWEQKSGKIANIIQTEDGFNLHHIEDSEVEIVLCFMQDEYMLRRWCERLGYKSKDGKTAKQFEEENGIKDEPRIEGKEIFRSSLPNDKTSITQYGERKFQIVSGDYAIVAKRSASNSYEISLLTSEEYSKWLEENFKQ